MWEYGWLVSLDCLSSLPSISKVNLFLLYATGTALYFTRGRTVLLALPIMGACLAWALARESRPTQDGPAPYEEPRKGLLLSGLAAAVLLAWVCLRTFHTGPIPYQTPHPDYVFYAKSFEAMRSTGIEAACALDPILRPDTCRTPRPYHHFDLWLAGGWSGLTGLTPLQAYVLVYAFVLAMTLVWGFWSVQSALGRQATVHRLAALAAAFFTPLSFAWVAVPRGAPVWDPRAILVQADWFLDYSAPLVESLGLKLLPVLLLLVAATRLQLTRGFAVSAIPLAALCVLNPAAGAWIGGIGVALTWGLRRGRLALRETMPAAVSLLAVGLIHVWLYAGSGNSDLGPNGALWALPPPRWTAFLLARTAIQASLLYAPFLLFGAALVRGGVTQLRRLAPLGQSLLAASAIGFILWSSSSHGDGIQFFAVVTFPALNLLVLSALTLLDGRWARVALVTIALTMVSAWVRATNRSLQASLHDNPYAELIATEQVPPRTIGAFIRSPEELQRSAPPARNLRWNVLGGALGFLPNHLGTVSLNAPLREAPNDDPLLSIHESRRAFVLALSEARSSEPDVSVGLVQRRFIEENRIAYLILAPGVELPDALAPLVMRLHEDSRTGERFCWLHHYR